MFVHRGAPGRPGVVVHGVIRVLRFCGERAQDRWLPEVHDDGAVTMGLQNTCLVGSSTRRGRVYSIVRRIRRAGCQARHALAVPALARFRAGVSRQELFLRYRPLGTEVSSAPPWRCSEVVCFTTTTVLSFHPQV